MIMETDWQRGLSRTHSQPAHDGDENLTVVKGFLVLKELNTAIWMQYVTTNTGSDCGMLIGVNEQMGL